MKLYSQSLLKYLLIITILFFPFFQAHALNACPGQNVTLTWQVTSGSPTSCPTQYSNNGICAFIATAGSGFSGSMPVTAPNSGSCSVQFQCESGGSYSNTAADTLNVVDGSSCCNVGTHLANGETFWNGGACVVPSCGNFANNFPACNSCTGPLMWDGGSCVTPTGTWTAPSCPSSCGQPASNPSYFCSGGNGLCSTNSPATLSCGATAACAFGSITPNSCTIPANGTSCTMNMTWTSSGTSGTVSIQRLYAGNSVVPGTSGVAAGTIPLTFTPPGTYPMGIYDGVTKLSESNFVASCVAGTSWHAGSSLCLTNVVIGTFTLDTPTIPQNTSTNLNWTGVTGGGTVTCSIDQGVGAAAPIPAGSVSTGNRSVDTTFILTCTNGASTATRNVTLNVISGALSMSAPSCEIAVGDSTCTVTSTWVTAHTSSPKLVDMNTVATLSTLANRATPFTVWVAYGGTTFNLQDGATVLDTEVVAATLPPGSIWVFPPGIVVASPAVSLVPSPTSVSYGYTTNLTWTSSDHPQTTECHNATTNWALNANTPAQLTPATGVVATNPLTTFPTETLTLACTGPASPVTPVTANAVVNVCSSSTPVLINAGGACQGRPVAGLTITGNYTAAAVLHLSCTNSNRYTLKKNTITVPGHNNVVVSGPIPDVNIGGAGDEGTYTLTCDYMSFDGHPFTDNNDSTIIYSSTAPDPIVSLRATPASISKGSATVLTWTVMYPNSVQSPVRIPACKLSATPVCTGTCTTAQNDASSTVNAILRTGMTDANDPSGSRLINPNAVDQLPPSHPVGDWRALGKKTINLEKSMDFLLYCGPTTNSSGRVRVIVTSTNEG